MNFITRKKGLLDEDMADDGTDTLNELNGYKARLAVTWRSAEDNEGICGGLENRQAKSDNKIGDDEARICKKDRGGPENEGPCSKDAKTDH